MENYKGVYNARAYIVFLCFFSVHTRFYTYKIIYLIQYLELGNRPNPPMYCKCIWNCALTQNKGVRSRQSGRLPFFVLPMQPIFTAFIAQMGKLWHFLRTCLKRLAFKVTEGIAFGIGLVLTVAVGFLVYAYGWTTVTDTATSGTTLSSTMWNNLVDNVNYLSGQISTSWAVPGVFSGLKIQVASSTAISLSANMAVARNTAWAGTILPAFSVTIATTTSGANGLDTGSAAANNWYAVYAIYNGSSVAGLLSLSANTPTMPSGYTYYERLWWVRYGASGLLGTLQLGRKVQYVVGGANVANIPQMAIWPLGSISPSTATYVAVATTTYVPTTASNIILVLAFPGGSGEAYAAPNPNYAGMTSTNPPPMVTWSWYVWQTYDMTLESNNVYVAAYWATNILYCAGWEDNL